MAIAPVGTTKVVISGTLSNLTDTWNVVWHFKGSDALDDNGLANIAKHTLTAWTSIITDAVGGAGTFASETTLNRVAASTLNAAAHEIAIAEALPDVPPKGIGSSPLPSEVALVVSLLTAKVGKSYRGRSYMPGLAGGAVGAHGLVRTDIQTALATATLAAGRFIESHVHADDENDDPIWSVFSPTKGVCTPITGVRVGDTFDSQRRRRNDRAETYFVVTG